MRPYRPLLIAAVFIPIIAYLSAKTNWPYAIFISLLHVAALKETYFPSTNNQTDATSLLISPEMRAISWLLLSGPPPPHDVQKVRQMVDMLWPNVWRGIGLPQGISVEEVAIPATNSGGAVVYASLEATVPESVRNGHLFRPTDDRDTRAVTDTAIVFVHGGGLISGTVRTEYGVSAELSKRCQCPVLSVDYRILPESTIEEAVSDVVAAFDWMALRHGTKRISIVGGSAGGILALLSGLSLRDRLRRWSMVRAENDNTDGTGKTVHAPYMPASLGLLSPGPGLEWLSNPPDVHWSSLTTNHLRDGFMAGGFYHFVRHLVFDDAVTRQYFALALSDLTDLPPCLVTVGGDEVLLDGGKLLVKTLGQANVEVTFREYPSMPHVHHALYFWAKESSDALDNIVSFVMQGKIEK